MPKTRTELVLRALRAQGIPGSGQSPEPEAFSERAADLDPVIGMLFQRRIVDARFMLGVPEDKPIVPDAWFLPLARILAFYGSDETMAEEMQTLAALSQAGQDVLHEMADAGDSIAPVRACYF